MKKELHTKIICTIGPTSKSPTVLRNLIAHGADALRINLSHTELPEAITIAQNIRRISKTIPLILDTQGKETRVYAIGQKEVDLVKGQRVNVTSDPDTKLANALGITRYEALAKLKYNDSMYINDDSIELKFLRQGPETGSSTFVVAVGGTVGVPKNIRLTKKTKLPSLLTERDRAAIQAGKKFGVTEVSLSYIENARDIAEARSSVGPKIKLSSKIESGEAIKNLDELIRASDSIMIDRNDLGTEIGYERIPLIQKFITQKCLAAKKPIFVATHLLETMITKAKPTRGEVNDIVNLVLDGVSGLILSSETAVGENPVRILDTMRKLVTEAELVSRKNNWKQDLQSIVKQLERLHYI